MKKLKLLSFIIIGILFTNGPVYSHALQGHLTISGSSTVFPVMSEAQLRWQDLHQDVQMSVTSIGSGGGFQALLDEQADIAPMSRAPKDDEYQAAMDEGLEITNDTTLTIGLDALAIIVNNDNPVEEIDFETVQGIYNGTYRTWTAAFPDHDFTAFSSNDIFLVERDENSGTHDYFNEEFLAEQEVDSTQFGSNYGQYNSQTDMNSAVEATPNAIGYSGLAYVDDHIKALPFKGHDQNESVIPTVEAAGNGSYKLARPLYLVWDGSKENEIRDTFLDYMLSPEGQYIVQKVGYVPIENEVASSYTYVDTAPISAIYILTGIILVAVSMRFKKRIEN